MDSNREVLKLVTKSTKNFCLSTKLEYFAQLNFMIISVDDNLGLLSFHGTVIMGAGLYDY